jgi:hypothetical protein
MSLSLAFSHDHPQGFNHPLRRHEILLHAEVLDDENCKSFHCDFFAFCEERILEILDHAACGPRK